MFDLLVVRGNEVT